MVQVEPTLLAFAFILVAAVVSVEVNVSVAILELLAGFVAVNALGVTDIAVVSVLAELGGLFLIFLAGAEVNTGFLRRHYRGSLGLGVASFALPFLAVVAVGFAVVPDWEFRSLLVAAIAFSEVSVAVVFTVLRERGIAGTDVGRTVLAATFVANSLVMASLAVVFVDFGPANLAFIGLLVVAFFTLPPVGRRLLDRYGEATAEVEVRYILTAILVAALLAQFSRVQAAVVVFVLGLAFSDVLTDAVQTRLDAVGFGLLIPVFFFDVGLHVEAATLVEAAGPIIALFVVVSLARRVGVRAVIGRLLPEPTRFGTALMNARLTFATVVATFGLTAGVLDRGQFSVVVATVFLTAVVASLELRSIATPRVEAGADERGDQA